MDTKEKLYLGALLHDIGKFWQRTEWRKQFVAHAQLSADFLAECFPTELFIQQAGRFHHKRDLAQSGLTGEERLLAEMVYEADNLASWEREKDDNFTKKRLVSVFNLVRDGHNNRPNERFYQPISRLNPEKGLYQMPTNAPFLDAEFKKETATQWQNFVQDFKTAANSACDPTTLYYICKKYLWCHTSAYWKNAPEISLFEHSRLTAAIAACQYDFLKHQFDLNQLAPSDLDASNEGTGRVLDRSEKRYLLVLADLSGIQEHLYNIAHDNALKALKGRSFFLQQMMDATAQQILKELGLLDAHLLYSGGGVFYLLLPNTTQTWTVLQSVRKTVAQNLLREYHGTLSLHLAWDELCGHDFAPDRIKEKWANLSAQKLHRQKFNKKAPADLGEDFFVDPTLPFGGVRTCDATGVELGFIEEFESKEEKADFETLCGPYDLEFRRYTLSSGQSAYQRPKDEDDDENEAGERAYEENKFISAEQFNAIRMGQRLKKDASQVRFLTGTGEFTTPSGLGIQVVNGTQDHKTSPWHRAYELNSDDMPPLPNASSVGWKFYGGNWFPIKEAADWKGNTRLRTADFTYLRNRAGVLNPVTQQRKGLKYLGVLRMDVDRLGDVFRNGLEKPPFSRIVQLSNMLDFFFSGYLNRLKHLKWDVLKGVNDLEGEDLEQSLQIIYAGGDDLCIVGKWNVLPDVACWINERFREFTGQNPAMTLSGGIALFGAKYPLFKVAEQAGDAEDRAKNYRRVIRKSQICTERNAFCFLDNPLGWDDFEEARRLARLFYQWVEEGVEQDGRSQKLPRSFLQLIQETFFEFSGGAGIRDMTPQAIEKRRYGPWRWHTAYLFNRMGERNKVFREPIQQLATDLFLSHKTDQEYLLVLFTAAQWADFLTREDKVS